MPIQPYLFFRGRCEEAIAFCTKTFRSDRSGMSTDRFGVGWMVGIEAPQEQNHG